MVDIDNEVTRRFPGLFLLTEDIEDLTISNKDKELEEYSKDLFDSLRQRFDMDSIKEDLTVRAYRDFYWSIGIDPTKTRPSAEALLRRVVRGSPLPNINTAVDAMNLVSVETGIVFSVFDRSRMSGNLLPVPYVEPMDVTSAVVWLTGDGARYITGVTLPVDAGFAVM